MFLKISRLSSISVTRGDRAIVKFEPCHCLLTVTYLCFILFLGEDRPRCVGCDEDITVKHILLDCVDFSDQRPRFYSSPNLKHLFTQVPGHQILSFFKAIGLYGKF